MVAWNSPTYTKEAVNAQPKGGGQGLAGILRSKTFVVTLTSAFALNDTLNFGYMPKGATLRDAVLFSDDIDTGGPTVTFDIGDAAVPARIFAASVAGQAAVRDRNPVAASIGFQYLADTPITGLIKAAATTPAAGSVRLTLYYTQDDFPTS